MQAFYGIFLVIFTAVGLLSMLWPPLLFSLIILLPLFLFGVSDTIQTRHGVRRNFPIIGNLRYFFEFIRPELQQYFVESNLSGRPIPREFRSIVYQRAKRQLQTLPFGTQRDLYEEGQEWVQHSICPREPGEVHLRVMVGGPQCKQPYLSSIFNISAMSYGSLSQNAIEALNKGAKKGGFYHNTGEGGISEHHRHGGDLVWQLGTAYFGCRDEAGRFSAEKFAVKSHWPEVKMIEIKLSQGAKPGKGGILPGLKVSEEIAEVRDVPVGQDVISPPAHSAFSTPTEMLQFVQQLRELSGGKPIGIKFCVGKRSEFLSICKAMRATGIYVDFITVDGAEGGTGAAPLEFSNSVGVPLEEGLAFVVDALNGFDLKRHIRVIAAGKVFSGFHILTKMAMGADIVNSARGMMLALGCIQALKCNQNVCPVGVATTDPKLIRGLHVPTKADRVANFQGETVHSLLQLVAAMGYQTPQEVQREDVHRRLSNGMINTYEELFPSLRVGELIEAAQTYDRRWVADLARSSETAF